MNDEKFGRTCSLCVLGVLVILSAVFFSSYFASKKVAELNLEEAADGLAELSVNLFGGFEADENGDPEWIDPVLAFDDDLTIADETHTLAEWLDVAGENFAQAFDRFKHKQNWKSKTLATNADRIYTCVNALAELERAELQLVATSLNANGGYRDIIVSRQWVDPVFDMQSKFGINGRYRSMKRWLEVAGGHLGESYLRLSGQDCKGAAMHAEYATKVYGTINHRFNQPPSFWRLERLAVLDGR